MDDQITTVSTATSGDWVMSPGGVLKSRDIPKDLLFGFLKILGITEGIEQIERVQVDMNWGGDGLVRTTLTKLSPAIIPDNECMHKILSGQESANEIRQHCGLRELPNVP